MVDQIQEINPRPWQAITGNASTNSSQELPLDMTFHGGHVVSIVSYSIMMVLSGLANITVLVVILKHRAATRNRSMINVMLINLAIADLLVTFLMMPLEIGWNSTVSWWAGDAMCRIMAFFRIFGLYLSGNVLMCISIDRYYAVLKPMNLSQMKQRGRLMLATAWIASLICSIPQTMIFHVERHPNFTDYEQCISFNTLTAVQDLMYKYFGMVMMYGLPLVVIVFCYSSILCEIYSKYKASSTEDGTFRRSSAEFLGRARIKTLKMTITIVMGFIVCWTPYYVMCLWYWMDKESAQQVDQRIQKGLFLFASGNSIMNPIVYGIFNIRTTPPQSQSKITTQTGSTIPDVVTGNDVMLPSPKRRIWRLQWQRSFSSDQHEMEDRETKKEEKKKRLKWLYHVHSQPSFSSDSTDITDVRKGKTGLNSSNITASAEERRQRWCQKPQKHNLSQTEQTHSMWRSWLSHQRISRLPTDGAPSSPSSSNLPDTPQTPVRPADSDTIY